MAMNRREARELAFTLLYEQTFFKEEDPEQLYQRELILRDAKDDKYLRKVVLGVCEKMAELDALIEENSNGWKVKRISKVSLAIMRLAIYEMMYLPEIPFNVSINEAVELCKKYNDEKAPAFVNGILNTVADRKGLKG